MRQGSLLKRLRLPSAAGLARQLALGAIWGTLLDGLHTHSGTTAYAHPGVWLMAWWVPPLFAGTYALLGIAYENARGDRRPEPLPRALACAVVFSGLYALSGYLPVSNATKLVVLLVGAMALWVATGRGLGTVLLAVVAAVLGPATEVVLVHIGAFAHLQPDFLGIPVWLPALYLASAPGGGPIAAWVARPTPLPAPPAPAS